MNEVMIDVKFGSNFEGTLTTANQSTIQIGSDQIRPYDMMLGALTACFHHTFLEVMTKKRQQVDHVEYHVHGRKRDTVPMTLEHVRMDIKIASSAKQSDIEKSIELAKKYCSVYNTISHVATIEVSVEYV